MPSLVNAERISVAFGTRILLDAVSLGLSSGDVIGVVGRNGDGKSSLLKLLTGRIQPDSGQVIRSNAAVIGYLDQSDEIANTDFTVRDIIVAGQPDHVWAANTQSRVIVTRFLENIDLDAPVAQLSGGERRRVALTALLLADRNLLVLDEPTNHLDVEAVAWLAEHLNAKRQAGTAMLIVSHDRWFLDATCNRIWEVHDAQVDGYEGGYAAYVLARAERLRHTAATEARRRNLVRKELAWLRRGPPARTSKPRFRIDAANALIADVPEPRDQLRLRDFAMARLGKDVFDLVNMTYSIPNRTLFDHLNWSIGPGMRIGIVGVNGSGKTTLLRLLDHEIEPERGKVKQGKTLRIGHLRQLGQTSPAANTANAELTQVPLHPQDRVLDSVENLRRQTMLTTGREISASSLLEGFGFSSDKLTTRIGELSGGELRRLRFLRVLLTEPNVLLLDEPTNDLDIDTLQVIEDYLDTWPGTLIVVSHDRYFVERTCDITYALLGDGSCVLLPGGIDEYLQRRQTARALASSTALAGGNSVAASSGAANSASNASWAALERQRRKDLARAESQLAKLETRIAKLHAKMSEKAADYEALLAIEKELLEATRQQKELEARWLDLAEGL
ncbi:MAG: ABC-F family ATP-binding cassette domain-containing protein [Propionibacteriaceae bacterium]|jgi:ATPase subunit of ABC transporter with duplicated ATPase domains|nr:ABC-F family ATP-binding cassette domain-containing protein [Propionibacteriaceae bacterium]